MKFLELLRRESAVSPRSLVLLSAVAGLSNALVLAIVNSAAEQAADAVYNFRYLVLFLLVLAAYVLTQKRILVTATAEVERILDELRVRLGDKIRHSDLLPLERIGRSEIYAAFNKEILTISQAAATVVVGFQSAILLVFTSLYLAWLSRIAFVLFLAFSAFALFIHLRQDRQVNEDLHEAIREENRLFDTVTDLLDGFKEVKLNAERSADLFASLADISGRVRRLRTRTQTQLSTQFVFAQSAFYVLMATMVFVVPRLQPTYTEVVVKSASAILFMIGPIGLLVGALPTITNANIACENIETLERALDRSVFREPVPGREIASFREIRFEGVVFEFTDAGGASTFTVGPLDATVHAGELLIVSGGNGSGKSTFLRLLTALYYPKQGLIRVDGRPLNESNYEAYRALFSVIFADYHLFKRLYGLRGAAPEVIVRLLREMELEEKTRLVGDEFETLDLSSGQRKRLALIVSLLEDRPVYVFDEWAADQDPVFRRRFYEQILPDLKRRGKTVVAVTHDDRYFGVADRRLKMEEGRFVDTGQGAQP